MAPRFDDFLQQHMMKWGRPIPARLQAALALLEKVRDKPSLSLVEHLAGKGSSGLESHETYGNRAHERLGIEAINKNHGRRSSNLQDWGQALLDLVRASGFEQPEETARHAIIDQFQVPFAAALRDIIEKGPLVVRVRGRTAEAVIRDVLDQADDKNRGGDVAQYLVGAKLMLRFKREVPALPANKGDRRSRSDRKARAADFEIGNAVIEVAIGLPDEKHLDQVAQALDTAGCEVWLLTRADRVETWRKAVDSSSEIDGGRVVVSSVESFVGQNISELGEFSSELKSSQLRALFDLYNERWVKQVGTPGIAIIAK